jgi:monovalent cation:H+ antiporter, CPA1 family
MSLSIERIEFLLLVAGIVALLARRIGLPYTVGLVAAGAALTFAPIAPTVSLTKDLIFSAFLPPLIFEAAIQMQWRPLRRDLPVTTTLATLGVALSAGITAAGIRWLIGWDWSTAILIGVVLAATDPVSVIATFKEMGVHGRLRMLVEAESLFNDGTAAVLFTVALAAMSGGGVSAASSLMLFAWTLFGGIAFGLLVGGVILLLVGRTEDHLIEVTFTTVAAYLSFLIAEHFHASGVLAALSCGILVGNFGCVTALSERGREGVYNFWEYAAFVANSLIFLLIGLQLARQRFAEYWLPALIVICLIMAGRAAAVYGCSALFRASRLRVSAAHQHVLFWGGLRGALALALVLGLPTTMPHRYAVITVTFAAVAFSIIAQGLTMSPLLRRLGELPAGESRRGTDAGGEAPANVTGEPSTRSSMK